MREGIKMVLTTFQSAAALRFRRESQRRSKHCAVLTYELGGFSYQKVHVSPERRRMNINASF
jgi:hypothetical protein